jgi:phosphohistidine phosphatase
MKLWWARHGEAGDPDQAPSDHARQLTDMGRRQVSQLTRWLLEREEAPQLILHSPLVRALQTAETIAAEVGAGVIVMEERLLSPGIQTASLLRRLNDSGVTHIACVGHQPDMSRCLGEMLGGGRHLFSPGSIAGVEFGSVVTAGAGGLCWLADPFWFE